MIRHVLRFLLDVASVAAFAILVVLVLLVTWIMERLPGSSVTSQNTGPPPSARSRFERIV